MEGNEGAKVDRDRERNSEEEAERGEGYQEQDLSASIWYQFCLGPYGVIC